jgi:fluoride ion exporter CrcB/FEX
MGTLNLCESLLSLFFMTAGIYFERKSNHLCLVQSPEDASLLCNGLQIGLLGCMSTVSTFVTEFVSLHQGPKRWRAYTYFCIMFFCSLCMGLLVYTLPVLTDHLPL